MTASYLRRPFFLFMFTPQTTAYSRFNTIKLQHCIFISLRQNPWTVSLWLQKWDALVLAVMLFCFVTSLWAAKSGFSKRGWKLILVSEICIRCLHAQKQNIILKKNLFITQVHENAVIVNKPTCNTILLHVKPPVTCTWPAATDAVTAAWATIDNMSP